MSQAAERRADLGGVGVGTPVGRVVHIRKDPYDVYIGRSGKGTESKWGNPFRIGDSHPVTGKKIVRGEAIELFKEWIARGEGRYLLKDLGELDGKTLGCFCAPKGGVGAHDPLVCHGQILLKLLEWRRRVIEEKRAKNRQAREHNQSLNTGREKIEKRALRDPRIKPAPVHRFHDDHEPTALFYCSDCQLDHPTPLIHDGDAPAGTQCDDCNVTNDPPDEGVTPQVPQRYIFCGSRGWDETISIRERLQSLPIGAIIVVGGARGADRIAEQVAHRLGMAVEVYPAWWDEEGKGAGYRRNERMLALPKVAGVFAFRMPGKSNGTDHMVKISREAGIDTTVQLPAKSYHLPLHQ